MPIEFTLRTHIARPPDDVFAYVADPARLHEWQTNVVEAEVNPPGPLATGSRIREVREVRGRRLEQTVEIAELSAPKTLKLRVVEGALPLHGDLSFVAAGDGTRVDLRAFGGPTGAARLLAPLLRIGLKREFGKQYARLKARLEAQ